MTLPSRTHRRVFALFFAFLASVAYAATAKFDIPAQPAPSALQLFIKQSGSAVMFSHDELANIQSNAVNGEFEVEAALARLLSGTSFSARRNGGGKFVVGPERQLAANGSIEGSVREEKSSKPVAAARVAIAGTDKSVLTDKRGRFALEEVSPGEHVLMILADGMQDTKVTDVTVRAGHRLSISAIGIPVRQEGPIQLEPYSVSAKKNDGVLELDPYAVEGQKPSPFSTASLDLTRAEDDVLPFNVFSTRDIELSGATNVEEFLRGRLSQFVANEISEESSNSLTNGLGGSAAGQISLRGWGAASGDAARELIILVNGRQLPVRYNWNSIDITQVQADIRSIPIGQIERIEVLSSAGSAIYGGGATSGAINIILRQDYQGGQLALGYETPWNGYAPKFSSDFNYTLPLRKNLSLRLAAGKQIQYPLNIEDRADWTIARWQARVLATAPTRIVNQVAANPANTSTTGVIGATTNIQSTTPSSATANLFGALGASNFTSVPDGYAGGQGLTPFLSRQGIYNLELSEGAQSIRGKQALLGSERNSETITVGVDGQIKESMRYSVEYQYSRNESVGKGGYNRVATLQTVPVNAPTNPFGQAVRIFWDDINFAKLGLDNTVEEISHRLSATLRTDWGAWKGLFDASYIENKNSSVAELFYAPLGGWQNAFVTGTYNPFVDMRVVMPAPDNFYNEYVMERLLGKNATKTRQLTAKLSGPVVRLPAGDIQLTAGLEWSRNDRPYGLRQSFYVNNLSGADVPLIAGDPSRIATELTTPLSRIYKFQNYSGYAETVVPLLERDQKIPLVRKLDLFGSARYEWTQRNSYDSLGLPVEYRNEPYVYAFGSRYSIVDGVTFRASRSIGFRPPSMSEVTPGEPPTGTTSVTDRKRDNELVILQPNQYLTGGNPDLKPETTSSTNVGLLTQTKKGTLRFSLDYVESVRTDAISGLGVQGAVDFEDDVAGRVIRGTLDGHSSGIGPITFVDGRQVNFLQITSKSADFNLEFQLPELAGGRLFFSFAASKFISFKVQTSISSPAVEQVRNPTAAFSRAVEWNGNGQLRWERGPWIVGWNTRYFDDILALPANYVVQGGDRAEWALEHDFMLSYRFPEFGQPRGWRRWLADTSVTVVVKNLFDREPRFWAANSGLGYVAQDSIVGRSVSFQVRKAL